MSAVENATKRGCSHGPTNEPCEHLTDEQVKRFEQVKDEIDVILKKNNMGGVILLSEQRGDAVLVMHYPAWGMVEHIEGSDETGDRRDATVRLKDIDTWNKATVDSFIKFLGSIEINCDKLHSITNGWRNEIMRTAAQRVALNNQQAASKRPS